MSKGVSDCCDLRWWTRARASAEELKGYRNGLGAASLLDSTVRRCVREVNAIPKNALGEENVPWEAARHIWNALCKGEFISAHAWALFTESYPEVDDERLKHHCLQLTNLHPIQNILERLRSAQPTFFTTLTLKDQDFERQQLLLLADMPNLVQLTTYNLAYSLDRAQEPQPLDDSIIRGWSRLAEGGGFPRLRSIFLFGKGLLNGRVMQHLTTFPRLTICAVAKDETENKAPQEKWFWKDCKRLAPNWKPLSEADQDVVKLLRSAMEGWLVDNKSTRGAQAELLSITKALYPEEKELPTLCILYGSDLYGRGSRRHNQQSVWCVRSQEDLPSASDMKRKLLATGTDTAPKPKKPRIRDGKQVSVEQLLGGF